MCLNEIYISLVLETFNDMLFELHQDKAFCKSVVMVSTNVSIEWLDVPIVVSSANMSTQVLVSERGRSLGHARDHLLFIRNCASMVGLFKYEENHELSMLYSLNLWIKRL